MCAIQSGTEEDAMANIAMQCCALQKKTWDYLIYEDIKTQLNIN